MAWTWVFWGEGDAFGRAGQLGGHHQGHRGALWGGEGYQGGWAFSGPGVPYEQDGGATGRTSPRTSGCALGRGRAGFIAGFGRFRVRECASRTVVRLAAGARGKRALRVVSGTNWLRPVVRLERPRGALRAGWHHCSKQDSHPAGRGLAGRARARGASSGRQFTTTQKAGRVTPARTFVRKGGGREQACRPGWSRAACEQDGWTVCTPTKTAILLAGDLQDGHGVTGLPSGGFNGDPGHAAVLCQPCPHLFVGKSGGRNTSVVRLGALAA